MVATATIQIIKIAWITYLGTLSCLNLILIPQISPHAQSWSFVRCTARGPSLRGYSISIKTSMFDVTLMG